MFVKRVQLALHLQQVLHHRQRHKLRSDILHLGRPDLERGESEREGRRRRRRVPIRLLSKMTTERVTFLFVLDFTLIPNEIADPMTMTKLLLNNGISSFTRI